MTGIETDAVHTASDFPLRWDVYRPVPIENERSPAIIIIHGGGLRKGSRGAVAYAAKEFAALGYLALCVEYRLMDDAPWPAQRDDVVAAMDALKRDADQLNVDPGKIYLAGFSAGANLAMIAASERKGQVAGLAAFFPIVSGKPPMDKMYGDDATSFERWGPLTTVAGVPPVIILTGDADLLAPATYALELHAALRHSGQIADLRLYSDLVHEFATLPGMAKMCAQDVHSFFQRVASRTFADALETLAAKWRSLVNEDDRKCR